MASNPPFELEDISDEDFFDKLVDDDNVDDNVVKANDFVDDGNVDPGTKNVGAKAAFDLSVSEVDHVSVDPERKDSGVNDGSFSGLQSVGARKERVSDKLTSSLVMSSSFCFDNGEVLENEVRGSGGEKDLFSFDNGEVVKDEIGVIEGEMGLRRESSGTTSGGGGVKEVQWSAFADSADHGGGFGSYDDFLSDFGQEVVGNVQNEASASAEFGNETIANVATESAYGYNTEVTEQVANGVETDVAGYYENQYPGWQFDHNTGQWYQLDNTGWNGTGQETVEANGGNTQGNVSGSGEGQWDVSDVNSSQVFYSQQNAQTTAATVNQVGTTENVSDWNHSLHQNGEFQYPAHMIFDPQYPGWYYDTFSQEWRSLEVYHSSVQSTVHNQHGQDGCSAAFDPDGGTGQGLNDNGIQVSRSENVNANQSYATSLGLYNQQGSNDGQSDFGMNIVSAASYDNGLHVSGSENVNTNQNYGTSLALYNQQGKNNGQSDFGMNSGSASSYGAGQSWPSYDPNVYNNTYKRPQESADSTETVPSYNKTNQSSDSANWAGFAGGNLQPFNHALQQNGAIQYSTEFYNNKNAAKGSQALFTNGHHASYAPKETTSLTGRPPHALVTFGFGGKLLLMKNTSASGFSLKGSKDAEGHSLSVLNLMEVIGVNNGSSGTAVSGSSYFQSLCYQSFPGPLVGGNAGSKEMNRWIDEKIANCDSMSGYDGKGKAPKLLISLLKVAWQHYGKLRSFGTDAALKDNDLPESAVASLFASAKGNNGQLGQNSVVAKCLIPLPSEAHIQAIASEVQNLLISGRKREALQRAQEGQLWGFALILARELGDQFYADTVKQMAVSQLVAGSPLRTLCLLIAKKPEEVFSINAVPAGNLPNAVAISPQPAHSAGYSMLANWEENLAVITANRTENDHLVITHLGDCLWKERNDVISAHICYLIAEADFELYSDTSRLCLIGADHWNFPRTYASPEAIQRTELFEYAKVTGNSQFVLLPLQPYKLIYAYMLAEVGRVSDSLKYCQAVLKVLKNGRSPEVDMLKQFSSSLEDRIRVHQQSGYAANLAPGKIVGRLLNLFDSTAHRVVGGLPPPAPSNAMSNGHHNQSSGSKVRSSQSTMGMSSLMPSASMEPINQWAGDGSKRALHSRSASEPNIGRTPRAVDTSNGATSSSPDGKISGTAGTSRFSRFSFGASIFQKTVGLVLKPRQGRQAKLGDTNKFYYNEKLKRWVEEGAEPPAEEPALAPPPTSAVFQTEKSDYYSNKAFNDGLSPSGGSLEPASSAPPGSTIGIPAFPPSSNQFSARGRMNVRSRYVDTFNKGGATPTMFQAPSIPSSQPANVSSAKFFIPTATSPIQSTFSPESETGNDASGNEEQKSTMPGNVSFQNPTSSAAGTLQRFPSVDNISRRAMRSGNSSGGPQSRRTASWSAIPSDTYTSPPTAEVKASPLSFMPSNHSSGSLHNSGGSFGDDLHEVEF